MLEKKQTVTILEETTKNPLQMIGQMSGICWNSPIDDKEKNIKRAKECILSGHGRVMEFPDIYMIIDGYSARVIREWYTHIGGAPTRLQSSTRYVEAKEFDIIFPDSILRNREATIAYTNCVSTIRETYSKLEELGVPREDAAMILPLGMSTKIVDKRNFRNLMDMSRQRMCSRAYWEYRKLFKDIYDALCNYSDEWKWLVEEMLKPKCEALGYCPENKGCGRYPKNK